MNVTAISDDRSVPPTADLVLYASRLVHTLRRTATVPPPHLRILALLDEHGATGVSRLAELDCCTQPSMSTMVATLAGRELVSKRVNPNDARAGLVEITERGRTHLLSARLERGHTIDTALERIDSAQRPSPEDVDVAVSVLRAISEAMQPGR